MVYFFDYPAGDGFALRIEGFDAQAGTHTLTGMFNKSSSFPNTSLRNYNATITNGTFTVNPIPLTVTTGTASKPYDGTALTSSEASLSGLADPDASKVTVTATGTITEIGSTANTYEIDWGGVSPDNYILTENLGTLTVEPDYSTPITVTAASATKVYDGTELTCSEYEVDGLPDYFTCEATVGGSRIDAGETDNVVSSCKISYGDVDVTSRLTALTVQKGTLKVEPAKLTVTTGSATKAYDGTELTQTEGAGITGLKGSDTATVTAMGTITIVGNTPNTYSIDWGTTNSANYTVTENLGTLTVTTNSTHITISLNPQSKVYDGEPLYGDEYDFEVTGLPNDDILWALPLEVSGSRTDVGTGTCHITDYMIGDSEESDVSSYFTNVTLVDGSLTVDKLGIMASVQNTVVHYNTGNQFPEVSVTYQNGPYSGQALSLQNTQESGTTQTRTYSTITGDTITVTVYGINTVNEPGFYDVDAPGIAMASGNSNNYTLSASSGCQMYLKLDPGDTGSPW